MLTEVHPSELAPDFLGAGTYFFTGLVETGLGQTFFSSDFLAIFFVIVFGFYGFSASSFLVKTPRAFLK